MRLEQLRYLSDIQHTNSISKTATRFFISQQSLSNNIRQLEKELDIILLERSPFGVVLTKEAKELLALVDPFLVQYDNLQNQFALYKHDNTQNALSRIKIFNSSVLISLILPKAIAIFSKKYPKIRITIKEHSYRDTFPTINKNDCDIAFLSINEEYFLEQLNVYDASTIHYNLMLTDRLVACISSQSDLAQKEVIEQSDIATHAFTYLDIVPLKKNNANNTNYALYTANNIELHRRILRELDVISLMPRYVYTNLFDNKYYIAKSIEGAQQTIYHAALYPTPTPDPIVKELVNIVSSLI